jgi:predicted enzyme related to lactoylglutathione lyase
VIAHPLRRYALAAALEVVEPREKGSTMSKFVHMELNTSDPEAAQKFYKAIFGWKSQKMKMDDGSVYIGIKAGEESIGGIQKNPAPDAPPHWLGYVGVDSIKKTSAKVEKSGGRVLMGEMPIPNMGSLAVYADPQGAVFAVWQPAKSAAAPETAAVQQAPAEAAPAKAKKTAKKAGGKKAAKKEAVAAEPAPAKASKKTAKKAGGKKAAKKQAAPVEVAPAPEPKKATKKRASKKG